MKEGLKRREQTVAADSFICRRGWPFECKASALCLLLLPAGEWLLWHLERGEVGSGSRQVVKGSEQEPFRQMVTQDKVQLR